MRLIAASSILLYCLVLLHASFPSLAATDGNTAVPAVKEQHQQTERQQQQQPQRLQVVYAGFGRTGTHSLGHALTKLGYNPIHGESICRQTAFNGEQAAIARAVIRHDYADMIDVTERLGFNATLDIHGMFWKEIMALRPDAKFIFMIRRDKQSWRRSMRELDSWFFAPIHRYPLRFFTGVERLNTFLLTMGAYVQGIANYQDCFHGTKADVDARFEAAYERFQIEMVQALRDHPNNTMLLDMEKGGYLALCAFLNVNKSDCPHEPFPRLGTVSEFRYRGILLRLNEAFVALVPLLGLYWLYKLIRFFHRGYCWSSSIKPKAT